MPKLTKRIVDAAEIQAAEYFIWDGDIPGLGLRVLLSGRKTYVVQFRAGRRSRRMSHGSSTVLTCEQARNRAIAIIADATTVKIQPQNATPGAKPSRSRSCWNASTRSISRFG